MDGLFTLECCSRSAIERDERNRRTARLHTRVAIRPMDGSKADSWRIAGLFFFFTARRWFRRRTPCSWRKHLAAVAVTNRLHMCRRQWLARTERREAKRRRGEEVKSEEMRDESRETTS